MNLNKNISDLIFSASVIAIPKPFFTRICFVTSSISSQIFLEASQNSQEWLSYTFSSQVKTVDKHISPNRPTFVIFSMNI